MIKSQINMPWALLHPSLAMLLFLLLIVPWCGAARAQDKSDAASTLIVLISGFGSDASEDQLTDKAPRGTGSRGMFQLMGDLKKAGHQTRFFNWNGTEAGKSNEKNAPGADAIKTAIRQANEKAPLRKLIIVGHSWGGHTMMEVAAKLAEAPPIKIALAIGVDPSSFQRGVRRKDLPTNIASFVNYHSRNAFVWGAWKNEERVLNINLGDKTNGFLKAKNRNYADRFDISAQCG